jgi:hypothetical protein
MSRRAIGRLCPSGAERRDDLVVLREAALALLREHELPVPEDVELAVPALDRLHVEAESVAQLGCETRSPAVVAVSDGAVVDLDAHGASVRLAALSARAPAVYGRACDDHRTAQLAQHQLEQERLIRRFQLTRSEEAAGQDAIRSPSRRRLDRAPSRMI